MIDKEKFRFMSADPEMYRDELKGHSASEPTGLHERITNYLSHGGLFNPEHMEHEKVRALLMECRTALTSGDGSESAGLREAAEYAVAKSDRSMRCWGCATMQVTPVGGPEYGPLPHDKDCYIEKLRAALAALAPAISRPTTQGVEPMKHSDYCPVKHKDSSLPPSRADLGGDRTDELAQGTFKCDICGKDTPHGHEPEVVELERFVRPAFEKTAVPRNSFWRNAKTPNFPYSDGETERLWHHFVSGWFASKKHEWRDCMTHPRLDDEGILIWFEQMSKATENTDEPEKAIIASVRWLLNEHAVAEGQQSGKLVEKTPSATPGEIASCICSGYHDDNWVNPKCPIHNKLAHPSSRDTEGNATK